MEERVIWEGKPSGIMDSIKEKGGMNATTYKLTNERIIVKSGLLSKKQEDLELVRVKDIRVTQGMKERLMKIGSVEITSTDSSTPSLTFVDVREPNEVKEMVRRAVKDAKSTSGVSYQERL